MKDPYRLENMTEDEIVNAKQMMIDQGILANHVDRIFDQPDAQAKFNKRPLEVRQKFFQRTGAMAGMDLGDIIRKRLESAPEEKTTDMRSIITERMADIDKAEKAAVNKEQQILAAAVPQVDASGRVVSAPAAPAPKRSLTDYVKGVGETVAALGSQAVVAPVAAGIQLGSDILGGKGRPVFTETMKAATYEPKTEASQAMMAGVAKLFEESKLPPVATGALPPVLPRVTKPAVKPRLTYQEFQVQQNVIKGQDPAGLPGVASVGAAGRQNPVAVQAAIDQLPVEMRGTASQMPLKNVNLNALESHVQALNLPEPIQLTKGQATGDLVALSNELNRRGELPNIAQRIGEQNKALVNNLTLIRDRAAPDVFGTKPSDFGQQVIDGYLNIDRQRNDNIRQLYGQLEQAAGGNFPIDAQKFVQSADQQLKKKLKSEFLPPEIDRQLQSYRDGSSMDFEQFESLRTNLATEIRKAERAGDGNKSFALGVVRDSLENLPLTGAAAQLKPLADAARKAAKERFDALRNDPAYNAAVNGKVAPESFIDTFVLSKGKGTEANVRQMMSALGRGSPEQQAIAAGLMDAITRKAVDSSGNFSQAAYNKILRDLEPKLLEVFDPDSAKQLKNLGEVSRKVMAQPKGSFANNSNTLVAGLAEKAGKALELGLNVSTANILPLGTIAKQARQRKAAEKFQRETLEPLAGTQQERTLGEILRGK
jgi:hypothetical protein